MTPTLPIDPDRAWVSLGELLARADSVRGILCSTRKEGERGVDFNVDSRQEQRQGVDCCAREDANGKKEGRFERIVTYAVAKYPPAVSVYVGGSRYCTSCPCCMSDRIYATRSQEEYQQTIQT